MEQKLIDLWNEILKCNDLIIRTKDSVSAMCFIVNKDYSMKIMALVWRNTEEKNAMRNFIKLLIVNQEILGYGFISDTYATNMMTKEVQEVVMRTFYTPKETITSHIIHKGKEVLGEFKMPEGTKVNDNWNLWNSSNIPEKELIKAEEEYAKFRQDNPEKYKEI